MKVYCQKFWSSQLLLADEQLGEPKIDLLILAFNIHYNYRVARKVTPRPGGCEGQNCGYLEMHVPLSSNCFKPPSSKSKRIARPRLEAMMEAIKSD